MKTDMWVVVMSMRPWDLSNQSVMFVYAWRKLISEIDDQSVIAWYMWSVHLNLNVTLYDML